jgi:hypothetical protein
MNQPMNHPMTSTSKPRQTPAFTPTQAPQPSPLIPIDINLAHPWLIPMPEGAYRADDIQSAIDLGEVYIEVMSGAGHWRWIFQKDCHEGGIEVNLSSTVITVQLNLRAMVRGVRPGDPVPDPKNWKLQGICFAHVYGVTAQELYRT